MPIEYRIDRELGVVHHEFIGEIAYPDFEQHWRRFLADPELPEPLFMIADMRGCRIRVKGEDVHFLVSRVIGPLLGDRRFVSAVAVASACDYGVTKQFIAYSDRFGETEVFLEMEEAIRWLTSKMEVRSGRQD